MPCDPYERPLASLIPAGQGRDPRTCFLRACHRFGHFLIPKTARLNTMDITKLEAARRQLETALNLYFHESDPVSIHTLAAAAHEVLTFIDHRHNPKRETLRDTLIAGVVDEYQPILKKRLLEAQNFFKHADRDPDGVLNNFGLFQAELLMLDGCFAYFSVARERPAIMQLYSVWAQLTFGSKWLRHSDGSPATRAIAPEKLVELQSMTRLQYFTEWYPIAQAGSYSGSRTERS